MCPWSNYISVNNISEYNTNSLQNKNIFICCLHWLYIFSLSLYPSYNAYQSILLNNIFTKHCLHVKICNSNHELSQRVNCGINTIQCNLIVSTVLMRSSINVALYFIKWTITSLVGSNICNCNYFSFIWFNALNTTSSLEASKGMELK